MVSRLGISFISFVGRARVWVWLYFMRLKLAGLLVFFLVFSLGRVLGV